MARQPYELPPGVADAIAKANKALTRISETQLNAAQEAARIVEAYRLDWVRIWPRLSKTPARLSLRPGRRTGRR